MNKRFLFTTLLVLILVLTHGQSIIVKSVTDDSLLIAQLRGQLQSSYSLCIRPVYPFENLSGKRLKINLLPVSFLSRLNIQHPYGWNDYGLLQSKGFQSYWRTGLVVKYRSFELQLAPEILFSQNAKYRVNPAFGPASFNSEVKIYPGQSFIKYSHKEMALSLSSENLWWGSGIYNALLVSNNAPGFPHLSFYSEKPKNIGIGDLEWHLTYGELSDAKGQAFENMYNKLDREAYPFSLLIDTAGKRIFNGLSISYHPKWIKGLYVGLSRLFQVYARDFRNNKSGPIDKYLPVLGTIFKSGTTNEDEKGRDQYIAIFAKGVFEKENLTTYFELGFNDHAENIRDLMMSPSHATAYTVGAAKLFFPERKKNYLLNIELTQMAQSPNAIVRDAGNWYWHATVYSGLTNKNQVLGAGVGGGNNVQTISLTELTGGRKRGVIFQRVERDPFYHPIKWTDFSYGAFWNRRFNNFTVGGQLQLVHSLNQIWEKNNDKINPVLEFKCDWKIK